MAFKFPAHRQLDYVSGNIVDDKAEVLVNTVNCRLKSGGRGVMGKGVALAFAERYPSIMPDYENAIRSGELRPGRALLFDLPDGRKWAALATKDDWRDPSRPEWVEAGLKELGEKLRGGGFKSVAITPPGCGNGGLAWNTIEPIVHRELKGVSVSLYGRPSGVMSSGMAARDVSSEPDFEVNSLARDERIAKPFYGTLVERPDIINRSIKGMDTEVVVTMLLKEKDGRKPVPVSFHTGPLSDADRYEVSKAFIELEPGQEVSAAGKWRKFSGGWEFSAARMAQGHVPLSGMRSDNPSKDVIGDPELSRLVESRSGSEAEPGEGRKAARGADLGERAKATMYFTYGKSAREDLLAKGPGYSTFEAILDGERTSTTRYDSWRGSERWRDYKEGDRIRFFEDKEMKGRSVVVEVLDVMRIDHRGASKEALDRWSKAEGWSADYGRHSAEKNGAGTQLRYVPVLGQPILDGRRGAKASVRKEAFAAIEADRAFFDGSRKENAQEKAAVSPMTSEANLSMASALMSGMGR